MVLLLAPIVSAGTALVDRVVAQVNDDVILLSQLTEAEQTTGESGRTASQRRGARRDLLDQMIDALLLKQEAERLGLEPPAELIADAVDERIEALRRSWPDPSTFESWLESNGMTLAELRQTMRDEESDAWRRRAVIVSRLGAPPADLDLPMQYDLAQIVLAIPADSSDAVVRQAYREILALREQALGGEEFARLADQHSDDPLTGPLGGDMGIVSAGQLDPGIAEALEDLQDGEISLPVRTEQGWHIFLVKRTISARQQWTMVAFEETRERVVQELRRRGHVQEFLED
jgi:parvulin-like peptidyl-prolyl isomerase